MNLSSLTQRNTPLLPHDDISFRIPATPPSRCFDALDVLFHIPSLPFLELILLHPYLSSYSFLLYFTNPFLTRRHICSGLRTTFRYESVSLVVGGEVGEMCGGH